MGAGEVQRVKPPWLKVRAPGGETYTAIKQRLRALSLHTVCEEARCPNMGECWGGGTATLMLMGDVCTRGCRFCAVTTGRPGALDPGEPEKTADTVQAMGLEYVVLTSVNRDDLADGGADHFARCVEAIKRRTPSVLVECLTPDFEGDAAAVARVVASGLDVFAHNVETVPRMQRRVRDVRATWDQSVGVLRAARRVALSEGRRLLTKTSIMVGAGETDAELDEALVALAPDVDVITFGQYLRPSPKHLEVDRYVPPETFAALHDRALSLGYAYCASGPLVRSSYRAGELYLKALLRGDGPA
ncbi:MAG: lipoyl synthase [Myxococcales bacterium]